MKERPILFSGPMVRAILDGRKTQTRRVVKPRQGMLDDWTGLPCPYGKPGDRLWVRETWGVPAGYDDCAPSELPAWMSDRQNVSIDHGGPVRFRASHANCGKWRPSIHMPRWASRITLEVVNIRVERLQDISEHDARAEGVEKVGGGFYRVYHREPEFPHQTACLLASISFRQLWKSINGPESWDENPWVWVVEFRKIEPTE